MSPWRGWNEQQIRSKSSTMTFTPINANHGASPPASDIHGSLQPAEPVAKQHARSGNAMAAVSKYLGRGESGKPTAVVGAPKDTAKRKKRGAPTSDGAPNAKARRTSGVSDTTQVTKQASMYETTQPTGRLDTHPVTPAQAMNTGSNVETNAVKTVSTTMSNGTNAVPVAVFSSITTMDALDSTASRTSMDAINANGGSGCTVYQSTPGTPARHPAIEWSQSWLHGQSSNLMQSTSNAMSDPVGISSPCARVAGTPTVPDPNKRPPRRAKQIAIEKTSNLFHRGEAQLQTPASRPDGTQCAGEAIPSTTTGAPCPTFATEDDFSGDMDEKALEDVALALEKEAGARLQTPPPRSSKQNMRDVNEFEDYGGALLLDAERQALMEYSSRAAHPIRPIVRTSFPMRILDRSPIFGASNAVTLRTCFRLGEALNAGSQAVRSNRDVVLEIYARVSSSWREPAPGRKQFFVLKDLYHDKPPHLEGTFELFGQSALWDLDSKVFLGRREEGLVCRTVAHMKRNNGKWSLEMLNIWEATLEDVEYAAGIYAAEDQENQSVGCAMSS